MKKLVCAISVTQHLVSFFFFFFPTGHILSSLAVILRTTDKIVWANEFERKLLEKRSNRFIQSSFSFSWFGFFLLLLSRVLFPLAAIELTCLIESISTNNPRIEWKKIKNGVPSYVYFQNKIAGKPHPTLDHRIPKQCPRAQSLATWMVPWKALSSVVELWSHVLYLNERLWRVFLFSLSLKGDLEHRAQLREPANILIFNTTRSDTAEYRCEVAAIDDQRDFDEILISLAVRGIVSMHHINEWAMTDLSHI